MDYTNHPFFKASVRFYLPQQMNICMQYHTQDSQKTVPEVGSFLILILRSDPLKKSEI